MRIRNVVPALLISACGTALLCGGIVRAQAPAPKTAPASKPATAKPAPARSASGARVEGNLLQVMRGILFPNSNVIFGAQSSDPAAVKRDADPSTSTNPLSGSYGGWEAVENSSIALAESANLLTIPGRKCSNGKLAPIQNADWVKAVQELREAGMATYKAAQKKNQDAIVDISEQITNACAHCHDVYREKTDKQGGLAARCTK